MFGGKAKGDAKGLSQGYGKDNIAKGSFKGEGKGYGKGFQGQCYACGLYGHSAKFCPTQGKGQGKTMNWVGTPGQDMWGQAPEDVSTTVGSSLCYVKPRAMTTTSNRWDALRRDDAEEEEEEQDIDEEEFPRMSAPAPPCLKTQAFERKPRAPKMNKNARFKPLCDYGLCEKRCCNVALRGLRPVIKEGLNAISKSGWNNIKFCVDSGAGETVMAEEELAEIGTQ